MGSFGSCPLFCLKYSIIFLNVKFLFPVLLSELAAVLVGAKWFQFCHLMKLQTRNLMDAFQKIVLVDSNDKGQLSMLRDQLSKSRLENNKLKNELQQLRYK